MKIRIGTRGSKLALVQAELVRAALKDFETEIVEIKTTGDIFSEKPLKEMGGKEVFTKEIDQALLEGRIDIAVHSLKDVPAIIPADLIIAATLKREDVRDSLIGAKKISELRENGTIGSSSPRRKAQILSLRPDLRVIEFRGNVETRITKQNNGVVDGTILACAGLKRLGLKDYINPISIEEILPAAGQGAIGIATRIDNEKILEALAKINHEKTYQEVMAERAVIRGFEGNCYSPVCAYAEIIDQGLMKIECFASKEDLSESMRFSEVCAIADAEELGIELGQELKEDL